MRSWTVVVAGLATLAVAAPARAGDPAVLYNQITDPVQRLYFRTAIANPNGSDVVYYWSGSAYIYVAGDSFKAPYPGAPGNHYPHGGGNGGTPLLGFEGYSIRRVIADPYNPNDFLLATREIVFYTHPATGDVVTSWTNPLTGKTTPVVPVLNEQLYSRYRVVNGELRAVTVVQYPAGGACAEMPLEGPVGASPEQWGNDYVWPVEVFPSYKLSDCGRYGITDPMGLKNGRYTSSEMFNFQVSKRQLWRVKHWDSAWSGWVPPARLSWNRTGPLLPWMCADEATYPAQLHYAVRSRLLRRWKDLPASFKAKMKGYGFPLGGLSFTDWQSAPQLVPPPPSAGSLALPAWDTSWSVFHAKVLAPMGQTWAQWCAAH